MPKILKDSEGNDVEVLSPEEVEAQQKDVVAKKEKELTESFTKEKTELQERLKTLEGQVGNVGELRKAKEEVEAKLKEVTGNYEKEKSEAVQKQLDDYKSQLFEALASKDPELKKKIEFHYSKFADAKSNDRATVDKLANDALKLAMEGTGSGVDGRAFGSGGGGMAPGGKGAPQHLIHHAKMMGMNEKEFSEFYQKAKEQGRIKE